MRSTVVMTCNVLGYWPLSSVKCQVKVFVILFHWILLIEGSVLDFQTSPDHVIGGLTKSVTLNCSLSHSAVSASIIGKRDVTQTPDNMATLTSLVVSNNDHDVAMVSSVSPAHVTDGSTNVQVSGSLSGNSGSGFIQLTITNPTVDQTGEFICKARGLSGKGHDATLTSSVEIVHSEASTSDLVAYVSSLNSKVVNLETNEANLKQEIEILKKENAELKNKTELMVYFNARINGFPSFSHGQVVVFDVVEESKGNEYNRGNGLFTCIIPGYYHFTLGCLSMPQKPIDLALIHNSNRIFIVYGRGEQHQGSGNAATLQLAKGDVVKIQVHYEDSTIDGGYCSFHGYLIQAL